MVVFSLQQRSWVAATETAIYHPPKLKSILSEFYRKFTNPLKPEGWEKGHGFHFNAVVWQFSNLYANLLTFLPSRDGVHLPSPWIKLCDSLKIEYRSDIVSFWAQALWNWLLDVALETQTPCCKEEQAALMEAYRARPTWAPMTSTNMPGLWGSTLESWFSSS